MSIDTYIYNKNFDINIFKNYITNNKPCLIKKFYIDTSNNNLICNKNYNKNIIIDSKYQQCDRISLLNYIKNSNLKCHKYGCNIENNKYNICCSNSIIEKLLDDQEYLFNDKNRIWKHKKNNFTDNHYDGNGVEVINISLEGKKRFYLASPSKTFTMMPLASWSINSNPDDSNYDYIIDLYPGDLLYIPSYWWHKVLTLEDSININYNFYVKDHKLSERQKNIFSLHKIANSMIWHKDNIRKYANLETVTSKSMIKLLLSECLLLLLLFLFLGYYISKFGIKYIIGALFILFFLKNYREDFSYGYFKTILHYMIPMFILGSILKMSTSHKKFAL